MVRTNGSPSSVVLRQVVVVATVQPAVKSAGAETAALPRPPDA